MLWTTPKRLLDPMFGSHFRCITVIQAFADSFLGMRTAFQPVPLAQGRPLPIRPPYFVSGKLIYLKTTLIVLSSRFYNLEGGLAAPSAARPSIIEVPFVLLSLTSLVLNLDSLIWSSPSRHKLQALLRSLAFSMACLFPFVH